MPYETTHMAPLPAPDGSGAGCSGEVDQVICHVVLWPFRSLPPLGFVWFIAATALLISLPLIALLGSPAVWGLLPFVTIAVAAIWWALSKNHRDRAMTEHLTIRADRMTLVRLGPGRTRADWTANPYWVTPVLHMNAGPVPNYVTLRGGDREVELGAFLSEPERIALHAEVTKVLAALR